MHSLLFFSKLFFIFILILFLCGGDKYVYDIFFHSPDHTAFAQMQNIQISPTLTKTTIPQTKTIFIKSVNAFFDYQVTTPLDWQIFKQEDPTMNTLTVSNGMYQIIITQAKDASFQCKYSDTQQPNLQKAKSKLFVSYVAIANDVYRRSIVLQESPNSPINYEVCEKGSMNFYTSPTKYGKISYNTPPNPTANMLSEMDTILGSIK